MLVKTFGSAVYGIDAVTITVETYVGAGEVKFFMVGMADLAVKESLFRIEAALKYIDKKMARQKLLVSLAPADIKKEGSAYDLTIAIGILACTGQLLTDKLNEYIIMGELSLDGGLQPIKGALPIAIQARKEGFKGLIIPKQNAREAAMVNNLDVYGVENISEVIDFLEGVKVPEKCFVDTRTEFAESQQNLEVDFSDVKGQENIFFYCNY